MGRTKKPCPCCGKVDSSRSADDICHRCRQVFNDYDNVLEILRDTQEKSGMTMPIMVGMAPHYNEYYNLPGARCDTINFPKELQVRFLNLAKAASVQSNQHHDRNEAVKILGKMEGAHDSEAHRLINKDVGEAIMQLRELIIPLAQEMYRRGQQEAEDIIKKYSEIKKIIRR